MNSVPQLRTLLALGRVSGLPTVWSNCLAGWWLGGGGNCGKLPLLLLGVSALYTGGTFLNDAFDQEFDRQRRAERPIPSGKISIFQVWLMGLGQLAAGILLLLICGTPAFVGAVWLAFFILLYDSTHKIFTASPWLMGICHFWVYVIAGTTGAHGLSGFSIFCGAALACYVAGLSQVARRDNFRRPVSLGPLLLLITPMILALTMNVGGFRKAALWVSFVLILWLGRCLRTTFFGGERNAGWLFSNLLAGIVLVDWLAVAPILSPTTSPLVFVTLFGLTKWFQKFIPAA